MYIVEGNIGAGKTTFLSLMNQYLPRVHPIFEPIDSWHMHSYGGSLLNNFYGNPKRWSYTIETLTMKRRFIDHMKEVSQAPNDKITIMERSIYSGYYCFATNGYKAGMLSPIEWSMYTQWFSFLVQQCTLPRGFIYLKVDPEISYERIRKRNRMGEQGISFGYVRELYLRHQEFLIERKSLQPLNEIPVLVVECNEEFEQNKAQCEQHMKQVQQFI